MSTEEFPHLETFSKSTQWAAEKAVAGEIKLEGKKGDPAWERGLQQNNPYYVSTVAHLIDADPTLKDQAQRLYDEHHTSHAEVHRSYTQKLADERKEPIKNNGRKGVGI